jgi:hypothetical protein
MFRPEAFLPLISLVGIKKLICCMPPEKVKGGKPPVLSTAKKARHGLPTKATPPSTRHQIAGDAFSE